MIKINLVSEGRKPVVARKAKEALGVGETSLAELLVIGLLLAGILVTAGYWWTLRNAEERRKADIVRAQEEVKKLELVLKEVEEFKRKKAELEHKIKVINDLKEAQKGPVKIMDQISQALPELLWLTNLELRNRSVQISGQAFNTNQVATFMENINKVPEFKEPFLRETARARDGTYGFQVRFEFIPPPSPVVEGGEQQAAAGG